MSRARTTRAHKRTRRASTPSLNAFWRYMWACYNKDAAAERHWYHTWWRLLPPGERDLHRKWWNYYSTRPPEPPQ